MSMEVFNLNILFNIKLNSSQQQKVHRNWNTFQQIAIDWIFQLQNGLIFFNEVSSGSVRIRIEIRGKHCDAVWSS